MCYLYDRFLCWWGCTIFTVHAYIPCSLHRWLAHEKSNLPKLYGAGWCSSINKLWDHITFTSSTDLKKILVPLLLLIFRSYFYGKVVLNTRSPKHLMDVKISVCKKWKNMYIDIIAHKLVKLWFIKFKIVALIEF